MVFLGLSYFNTLFLKYLEPLSIIKTYFSIILVYLFFMIFNKKILKTNDGYFLGNHKTKKGLINYYGNNILFIIILTLSILNLLLYFFKFKNYEKLIVLGFGIINVWSLYSYISMLWKLKRK